MEYYLCRAMEINRLSEGQLEILHEHELKDRVMRDYDPTSGTWKQSDSRTVRCLMPYEIQEGFQLETLIQFYGIPDDDNKMAAHNARLRAEMGAAKIKPVGGDLSVLDVPRIHSFDKSVRNAIREGKINLYFVGASSSGGRKLKDAVKDND